MQSDPIGRESHSKKDILLLYHTAQEWVRHYQLIIMQLNTWVTTFNAAIITFVLTSYFQSEKRPTGIFYSLLIPILLSVIVIFVNRSVDQAMRECFLRIVQIEDAVGLSGLRARDGKPLLPEHLKKSADVQWPHILIWLIVNLFVIFACALIIVYSFADSSKAQHNHRALGYFW